jgi:putative membrane protein
MKRNIGKFAANIAAAGMLLGAAVVWADDQTQQSSSSSTDQSQQAGQTGASTLDASKASQAREKIEAGITEAAADPQKFIKLAYAENLAEVKAGQLAQQKAEGQQTKDFAQSLVQDHQQALDQLKKLADQKNVQVSDQLGSTHQRMIDALSGLSGAEFDKRFMSQQVRAHKRAISLYQQAAQSNPDSEVKQWAQQNVAGLQHHLQMAQQAGGISEPAGAPSSSDQGSSSQGAKDAQGSSSSSSSSSQDQSGKSGQAGQSGQSGQPAQPSNP